MAPDLESIGNINVSLNGFSSADFNCDANFYNPNDKKIVLKHVDIDVDLDGTFLTSITRDYDLELAPMAQFTVPVEANIPFKNIGLNEALELFKNSERYKNVHFKGKIRVKMYGMNFKIPIDHHENIKLD
jgi:LEA14-like dessication related protein